MLLGSIDEHCSQEIEIVICEDFSPKRDQIRAVVDAFMKRNIFKVNYIENEYNLGFDRNLRHLIRQAEGEYIIFMGDDDVFVKGNLINFINFLKNNRSLGYVLKTWQLIYPNGRVEYFNYFKDNCFFRPGIDSYAALYRISVFISGFTFKREYAMPYLDIDDFDGTLLYQMYLLAEITLKYPSAFCSVPLTQQSHQKTDVPHFGSSKTEKDLYTPGEITVSNSINFMKGHFRILKYIDDKYSINATESIRRDYSKYSYRVLAIQRKKGLRIFLKYHKRLANEVKINVTIHYYVYLFALILLGDRLSDQIISLLKKVIGQTPSQ
jgi:glycosyltransferase involved in cell wall biosynthesis